MSIWWSVILATGSVWMTWLVGERRRVGWLVGVAVNVVWLAYAVVSGQWGFLASSTVFIAVNTRNYVKWRRHDLGVKLDRELAELTR